MSFNTALQYIKAKFGAEKVDAGRLDTNLPLGLRIGSVVTINPNYFIRASLQDSFVGFAGEAGLPVVKPVTGISTVKFDGLKDKIYRFYFSDGEDGAPESFLQLFGAEIFYCTAIARFIPSPDEVLAFTGRGQGEGLGSPVFTIYKDQVEDLIPEEALAALFKNADYIEYQREGGEPDEYVPPYQGREVRMDDEFGSTGIRQEIHYMPYARSLADGHEFLMISTEVVVDAEMESSGGQKYESVHVDIMVGMPITTADLQVL